MITIAFNSLVVGTLRVTFLIEKQLCINDKVYQFML